MLYIVLTFDYEIYFGKNNETEDEVLFKPTDQILDILNEYNLTGTFFADVCSVDAYNRQNPASDYPKKFTEQIKKLTGKGQDVQLHIHPHWITARYNGGWNIEPSTYRIHYFMEQAGKAGTTAEQIIDNGIHYLTDTLTPINRGYQCYAFRAGGYCLQPEEKLLNLLASKGIKIDSSVAIGKELHTETHDFDYKREYKKLNWNIGSGIYEVPIGSVKNSLIRRAIPCTGAQTMKKEPPKGEGISGSILNKPNIVSRFIHYNKNYREFGLENTHYKQLLFGLNQYRKKYHTDIQDCYVAVICHPKAMETVTLNNMRIFLEKMKANEKWVKIASLLDVKSMMRR